MLPSMIEAAKEEIPSSFPLWCADSASAASLVNLEKPHQGVAPEKSAPFLGQSFCNSTNALGLHSLAIENRVRSRCKGKERDAETQNDDFGAREYSWRFGRWLSSDWSATPVPVPYANLTNPQTLNLYAMVADDPETSADLDGHVEWAPQLSQAMLASGPINIDFMIAAMAGPSGNAQGLSYIGTLDSQATQQQSQSTSSDAGQGAQTTAQTTQQTQSAQNNTSQQTQGNQSQSNQQGHWEYSQSTGQMTHVLPDGTIFFAIRGLHGSIV